MDFWVYILRCADGSYYTGHTDNLELRVAEHESGAFGGYTAQLRPVTLAFAEAAQTRDEGIVRERQIKNWSRVKKEALISSDWRRLRELARGRDRQ